MSDKQSQQTKNFVGWKSSKDGIEVSCRYQVFYKQNAERISGCIPSLGIYLSAKDMETFTRKEKALSGAFLDTFFLHMEKNSIKKIIVELSKRGFVSQENSNFLIHRASKNDIRPTKFKAKDVGAPAGFEDAESLTKDMRRSVALA